MNEQAERLREKFIAHFGAAAVGRKLTIARAPGRVSLMGDDLDANEGCTLTAAVGRDVLVAAQRRPDQEVHIYSPDFDEMITFPLSGLHFDPSHGWANYPKGVLWAVQNLGHKPEGMNIAVSGLLPQGSGMCSSAALLSATARAITSLGMWPWEPVRMARLCLRAETEFVGTASSFTEHAGVSAARAGQALWVDTRSFAVEPVPFALPGHQLFALHTGSNRRQKADVLKQRLDGFREAVRALKVKNPKYRSLRDLGVVAFERYKSVLSEKVRSWTEHIAYENERAVKAKDALLKGDVAALAVLMARSQKSLQRLLGAATAETDWMAEHGTAAGALGARLSGPGFGGSMVFLATESGAARLQDLVHHLRQRQNIRTELVPVTCPAGTEELA